MNRAMKIGLVVAGYVAALVAGTVAEWLYNRRMAAMPYDTSGGMYAGGEILSWLAAFLVVAMVPTLLALWFLRRHEGFWNMVAGASLVFAAAGLLAVLSPLVVQIEPARLGGVFVELLRLAHLLGAPLWFIAFALFTLLAPSQRIRRKLVAATTLEVAIGLCALVHWLVPRPPL